MSETNTQCKCAAKHEGHLCVLHSRGLSEEIAKVTDSPTVVCFSCGREANCPDNVCVPMEIKKACAK